MGQPNQSNAPQSLIQLGCILQTLQEESNLDTLVAIVLAYFKTNFSYDLIWVGLYDRPEQRLVGKGGKTPLGDHLPLLNQRIALTAGDVMEKVVIHQASLVLPDLRQEVRAKDWHQLAQKTGIQGTSILPICFRNECFGVFMLGSKRWGSVLRAEEKILCAIVLGRLAAAIAQQKVPPAPPQKQIEASTLDLLNDLRSLPDLASCLNAAAEHIHQLLQPSRTSVYWLDQQDRYFWRRTAYPKRKSTIHQGSTRTTTGIPIQAMSGLYQALLAEQVVSIGETLGSTRAEMTSRTLQQMQARSLLAAPILYQNQLLGFLAAEGSEPRVWQAQEKHYLRTAAQLVSLVAPLETMVATVEQTQLDQALTAEIAKAIHSAADWKSGLKQATELLSRRLQSDRVLILQCDRDLEQVEVCYQTYAKLRHPLSTPLTTLSSVDQRMLEQPLAKEYGDSSATVAIVNLSEDLRLANWRKSLMDLGLQSVMVCNTTVGQTLAGVLLIGQEQPRFWTAAEQALVQVVAQQIGLILRQWQLQQQNEQQQETEQIVHQGLISLQQAQTLKTLEPIALQAIAHALKAPMVAMVSWGTEPSIGRLVQLENTPTAFYCEPNQVIPVQTDALIRQVLDQAGFLPLARQDIPATTRQWLNAAGIEQLLAIALRVTSHQEPTGILLIGDHANRHWLERDLTTANMLIDQLAWFHRHHSLLMMLQQQRDGLEQLNWYKHRRIEDLYRVVKLNLKRLATTGDVDHPALARQQQVLQSLGDGLTPLQPLLLHEQWHLQINRNPMPLLGLLRRTRDRIESLVQHRQLWFQIHQEDNLVVHLDPHKLEFVLYEVLRLACQRSQPGEHVDIWCRSLNPQWVEIAITDTGLLDPRLMEILERGRPIHRLTTTAEQPSSLHLSICQSMMQAMGGELSLHSLEDGRNMSRVVLPTR